jgi:hypothetical protein
VEGECNLHLRIIDNHGEQIKLEREGLEIAARAKGLINLINGKL